MKRLFLNKTNIVLFVVLILVAGTFTFLSYTLINNEKSVIVPDFYLSSKTDVENWCNSFENNNPCTISEDYSDVVKKDSLISQSINPGEKFVDTISFVFSLGKKISVNAPRNDGELNKEKIDKWVLDNSLDIQINFVEQNNDIIAKGYVISFEPLIITNETNQINVVLSSGTRIEEDGSFYIKSETFYNLKPKQLELKAEELGLILNHNQEKDSYSNKIPVGYIIWHGSGTYKKEDTLNYGLSLGPNLDKIIVDSGDFVGKSEEEFIELVKQFEYGELNPVHNEDRDEYSNTIEEGYIIWHGSGEYEDGENITYGLSLGKDTRINVNSGDFVGLTYEEFEKTVKGLGTKGLVPKHVNYDTSSHEDDYSDSIPKGNILWHGSGSYIDGESISYVLSLGPVPLVVVASFSNKSESDFIKYINSNHLTLGTRSVQFSNTIPEGYIIKNDTGSKKEYSEINYVVSKGSAIVVNDYSGKSESTLISFLDSNELNYSRKEEYSDKYDEGIIIKNDTGNYAKGEKVNYTVSKGAKPVEKYTIMRPSYYNDSKYDTYDKMVDYLNNTPFKYFTNVTYVGKAADKTAGVILSIEVDGDPSYSSGDYPSNTPIKIVISTGFES